uniref:Uncharacterized protein n=1 Tax=Lepeophtheirus salmonis TaxID=72036 RepID=A0A0K2UPW8_LEPSM
MFSSILLRFASTCRFILSCKSSILSKISIVLVGVNLITLQNSRHANLFIILNLSMWTSLVIICSALIHAL